MLSTRWGMAVIVGVSLTAASASASDGPFHPHAAHGPVHYGPPPAAYAADPAPVVPLDGVPPAAGGAYPVLNAPLYPSPVQHVPPYAGGTIITNQALAPHEMLYPHAYHAMYPPFYYRVTGHWFVTPFGVRQHENWKLEGTHVKVKYRDHYRPFSQYSPPVVR